MLCTWFLTVASWMVRCRAISLLDMPRSISWTISDSRDVLLEVEFQATYYGASSMSALKATKSPAPNVVGRAGRPHIGECGQRLHPHVHSCCAEHRPGPWRRAEFDTPGIETTYRSRRSSLRQDHLEPCKLTWSISCAALHNRSSFERTRGHCASPDSPQPWQVF